MIDLPALLKSLKLLVETQGNEPVIAEDDITVEDIRALLGEIDRLNAEVDSERNRLGDECDRLVFDWHEKVQEVEKQRDQCQAEARSTKAELKKFKAFALDIRDGYDCETGANGVHAPFCRCCVAEELLGLPPHEARDQRTRGG